MLQNKSKTNQIKPDLRHILDELLNFKEKKKNLSHPGRKKKKPKKNNPTNYTGYTNNHIEYIAVFNAKR